MSKPGMRLLTSIRWSLASMIAPGYILEDEWSGSALLLRDNDHGPCIWMRIKEVSVTLDTAIAVKRYGETDTEYTDPPIGGRFTGTLA